MNTFIYRLCAGFFLFSVLAAGNAVPDPDTPDENVRVSQANADMLSVSSQFRSETPVIVLFDENRIDLDGEAQRRLDIQASWLLSNPGVRIRVYGYALKEGNTARNMALSLRRAQNVVMYLNRKGIESHRLEAMVSFGEEIKVNGGGSGEAQTRHTISRVIGVMPGSTTAEAGRVEQS